MCIYYCPSVLCRHFHIEVRVSCRRGGETGSCCKVSSSTMKILNKNIPVTKKSLGGRKWNNKKNGSWCSIGPILFDRKRGSSGVTRAWLLVPRLPNNRNSVGGTFGQIFASRPTNDWLSINTTQLVESREVWNCKRSGKKHSTINQNLLYPRSHHPNDWY